MPTTSGQVPPHPLPAPPATPQAAIPSPVGSGSRPPRSKEVRIGLVMYGGVSLAVYINGVAREFFDLARGRGIWGVIQELTDSEVVIDVVSGASAGGINGLYLSYALCNQCELEPLSRLWRERAGFGQLLQDAGDQKAGSVLNSDYMESELEQAFLAMRRAPCDESAELAPARSPAELDCFLATTNFFGHLDTLGDFRGTPLLLKSHRAMFHLKHRQGRKEPFGPIENGGPAGSVVDRLRQLRRGTPAGKPRLAKKGEIPERVLAKMARATSAFPVAFEPVILSGEEVGDHFDHFGPYLGKDEQAVFIDGGVLDNKPFTPILPAIYERHAVRPVERILFFVEPDPENEQDLLAASARAENGCPNFFRVAASALTSLPSYESIAGDLRALDEHNRRLDLLKAVLGSPYGAIDRGDPFEEDGERDWCDQPPATQWTVYQRARLHQMLESMARELPLACLEELEKDLLKGGEGERAVAATGAPEVAYGTPGSREIDRFQRFFDAFLHSSWIDRLDEEIVVRMPDEEQLDFDLLDVQLAKRAYYYWIYELHGWLGKASEERWQARESERADDGREVDPMIERVRWTILFLSVRVDMLLVVEGGLFARLAAFGERHRAAPAPGDGECEGLTLSAVLGEWRRTLEGDAEVLELVTATTDREEAEELDWKLTNRDDVNRFKRRWDASLDRGEGPPAAEEGGGSEERRRLRRPLLEAFFAALDQALAGLWDLAPRWSLEHVPPRSAQQEFRLVDAWRLPALLLSQLGEMDRLDYVRISPRDAAVCGNNHPTLGRWRDAPMSKVAGRQLGHFGAFLKRSWRSNDILWGRLDAATVILDTLLRKRGLALSRRRAGALAKRLRSAAPGTPDAQVAAALGEPVTVALETFADGEIEAEELAQRLLHCHQEAILAGELPTVIRDAIHEETLLRQPRYDLAPPGPLAKPLAGPGAGREAFEAATLDMLGKFKGDCRDPLLRRLAAEALVLRKNGGAIDWEAFFEAHYDVGNETVTDMDTVTLATTGLHAGRVLGNMCRRELPARGPMAWLNKQVLGRATLGLTTLHLASRSIRDGWFPILWLAVVVADVALLVMAFARESMDLPVKSLLALLALLLVLPSVWFGRFRRMRWVLLGLVVGVCAAWPASRDWIWAVATAIWEGGKATVIGLVDGGVEGTLLPRALLAAAAALAGALALGWTRRRTRRWIQRQREKLLRRQRRDDRRLADLQRRLRALGGAPPDEPGRLRRLWAASRTRLHQMWRRAPWSPARRPSL